MLPTSLPAVMVHVFPQLNCVTERRTVQAEKMRTEPVATQVPSHHQSPQMQVRANHVLNGTEILFVAPCFILAFMKCLFVQPAGPMSSAVPLVASVCLGPGAVMGKRTAWMEVMSSSVLLRAVLARCPASAGISVLIISNFVMVLHIAEMPQMRVSTTVVS